MHRRIIWAVTVVAVGALVWLGGTTGAQAATEIQFWHAMRGARGEAIDALAKQFNQSQREFEVKALYKGTYPEVLSAAMAAYRQKTAPHIVQVFDVGTQSMILSDAIVPIYRLMRQQHIAVNWADFLETVTGYYSQNGRLYSLPFNVSTPILYYNKDVFRKAGLDNKSPVTWQDVETVARRILAAGAATCGFTTGGVAVLGSVGEHIPLARPALRHQPERLHWPRHQAPHQQ